MPISQRRKVVAQRRAPQRAYKPTFVPLASRGYIQNQVERKVNDIGVTDYAVNSTGSVTLLCNPALGSDMNNRIGRKIMIKSFYIRGYVAQDLADGAAVGSGAAALARMIVFADFQPNGAAPGITDVLNSASPSSQLNLNNRDRFKVYCDKTFINGTYKIDTTASSSYGFASDTIKPVKKYKKINLETVFNSTNGGTIGDINSGALFMLWIGSNSVGTADQNANISTRVRYLDV